MVVDDSVTTSREAMVRTASAEPHDGLEALPDAMAEAVPKLIEEVL